MEMGITKQGLKASLIEALVMSKKFRLAFRPHGVKFEEDSAMVLLNTDTYNGFSIGDLCLLTNNRWYIYYGGDKFIPYNSESQFRIAAFVEMNGHLQEGTGIRVRDIFCVLAPELYEGGKAIQRVGHSVYDPILLFWLASLEKIEQE